MKVLFTSCFLLCVSVSFAQIHYSSLESSPSKISQDSISHATSASIGFISSFVSETYLVDLSPGNTIINPAPTSGSRIGNTLVPAIAVTAYSGIRQIITDFDGSVYRLRDYSRGRGIVTLNLRRFADYSSAVDFTNSTTTWDQKNVELDQFATDVHWNTEKTFDYYFYKFNRNSIDDNGFALTSYVHYGVEFQNAFWDGAKMSYGDGFKKPFTTLDLCGHEITHGVTQFTSGLLYTDEAGALNEGISDIFGTAIEHYARPENWDWRIGGDASTQRDLSNPNAFLQPDTYKGAYWYTGSDQNQIIHRNSSVLGYWFYLLTQGGSGKNDFGTDYLVNAIGMEKAEAIAYYMNSRYLFPNATYLDAVFGSIRAAEDLYGEGAMEVQQTANAWAAVGLALKPGVPKFTASTFTTCAGDTTTLSIVEGSLNSGSAWKWYAKGCGENPVGTGDSINVTPVKTTLYYVREEGRLSGIGHCATLLVTVKPRPVAPPITSNGPPIIIGGRPVLLSATAGYVAYQWSNGKTGNSITVDRAGDYSVKVTDGNACTSPASPVFHVLTGVEAPPVITGPTTVSLCAEADKTYIIPKLETSGASLVADSLANYSILGATSRKGMGTDASGRFETGVSEIKWTLTGASGDKATFTTTVNITDCNNSAQVGWLSDLVNAFNKAREVLEALKIKVVAYPNPSNSSFKILVKATGYKPLTIIIRDYSGRVIERKTAYSNSEIELGKSYQPGMYFAELIYAGVHMTVKLVKL